MDLSVVVPVYNEVENVEPLLEKIYAALAGVKRSWEVVLVDDGSRDGTWEKLKELGGKYRHLRLIRFRGNFGQTAAMSAGFHNAKGDIVVTMDADLQNDPADIPKLLERMDQGFDVVSGWRRDRKDTFINRRLPSMIANGLISRITGVRLHDYGCTLKAYRRDVIKDVHLYGEMHRFIPALASWVGGKVDEVVVTHHPRVRGVPKYGISRTLRVVLDLITVKFLMRYSRGPMQIFGKAGLALGVPGILMVIGMALAKLANVLMGENHFPAFEKRPFWIITAFMLIVFGIQLIGMGLIAEVQIRTWHESQGKRIYVIKGTVES